MLEVVVTNPDTVAYRILDLRAKAGDPNPECRADANLVIGSYQATKPGARPYVVPAHAHITVPLAVMMLDAPTSDDPCAGATFPFTFTGSATAGTGTP
jgi:hypothetical protein